MAVYVDREAIPYRRMKMCHMLADTIDELHAMADSIGIARRHFQGPPKTRTPHYDICQAKRALALQHGAVEITRRQTVEIMRRLRDKNIVAGGSPVPA